MNIKSEQKQTDDVQEVRQAEQKEQTRKLVGTMRPRRGHTLFKYNTITGELTKVTFEKQDASFIQAQIGKPLGKKKVVIAEEGCIYVSALNLKNAVKKLAKYHGVNVKIK